MRRRLGDADGRAGAIEEGADVNAAQGDGMTALHWAAQQAATPTMVGMLLSAGANVRATTRLGGYTPLHLASQAGQARAVAALLAAGHRLTSATSTGATPLMLGARSGSVETATRLLENGADVNAKETGLRPDRADGGAGLDRAEVVGAAAGAKARTRRSHRRWWT